MRSYPIYILELGNAFKVVFPANKKDTGHSDFWEQTASFIVAGYFKVPQTKLANLPYSQRRARIVGDKIYFGGQPDPGLLRQIRKAVGNKSLVFCYDDHERRLREDVRAFKRLLRRKRAKQDE